MPHLELKSYSYPEWLNRQLRRVNGPDTPKPSGVQYSEQHQPFLVLDPPSGSAEIMPDCVWWRNFQLAEQIRHLVDSNLTVVVPQKPTTHEDLAHQLDQHNLDLQQVWVYGSVLPEKLWKRSTKVQVHLPLPGDAVPDWFDLNFPQLIAHTTLPGFSCFTTEKLIEGSRAMLDVYTRIRFKNPNGASGEDQTVVGSTEEIQHFLDRKAQDMGGPQAVDRFLATNGYVVEANLNRVTAWSVTVTTTPEHTFTSIGQQVETLAPLPPEKGGGYTSEYGGTSAVTIPGQPREYSQLVHNRPVFVYDPAIPLSPLPLCPDQGVLAAAQNHLDGFRTWESHGIVRTRANIDILTGTLEYRNGQTRRVTGSVEDSGRVGGATSEEIRSALTLVHSPNLPFAVHSSRHLFSPEDAQPYINHIAESGGFIYWSNNDPTWGNKYLTICVY